ncbi:angioproteinsis [Homalodisca vitripennis]|nr:angioproteinsis [Homalodisca vitripennis]
MEDIMPFFNVSSPKSDSFAKAQPIIDADDRFISLSIPITKNQIEIESYYVKQAPELIRYIKLRFAVWAEITERRREVLRLHEGQGQPCPHLIETKSTTSNLPLCSHKYRWLASKWSACTLPNVMAEVVCGGGLQFRNITCVAAQGGQPLPTKSCHTIPPPPTVQRCEVACPRDCEVGPWGPWGPCLPLHCPPADEANLSSKGHRKRTRAVVVPPSALGLECPSLTEVQPCPHPACYSWTVEPWGACQLEPGTGTKCGTGRRTRRVACTTHSDASDFKLQTDFTSWQPKFGFPTEVGKDQRRLPPSVGNTSCSAKLSGDLSLQLTPLPLPPIGSTWSIEY